MSGWRPVADIWGSLKNLFAPGILPPEERDPPMHKYYGPTKTELVTEPLDTSKALHSDGNWHVIPVRPEDVWVHPAALRIDSVVLHVCSKSWSVKSIPDERGVERMHVQPYVVHRYRSVDLNAECCHCSERPPESVVCLWILHNWDYLCLNDHPA